MRTSVFVVVALAVAVGLATAISPFASGSPDGLEKVAEDQGFLDRGETHPIQEDSPIPDYTFPGIENESLATGVAGFIGTLVVFGLGYLIALALVRLRGKREAGPRGKGTPAQG